MVDRCDRELAGIVLANPDVEILARRGFRVNCRQVWGFSPREGGSAMAHKGYYVKLNGLLGAPESGILDLAYRPRLLFRSFVSPALFRSN